ncbi:MAG: hypothetical protein AB7J40_02860 [Candidatus Altimarinota bacterium]
MQNTLQNPAVKEVYRLVLDKCYRMNLLPNPIDPSELSTINSEPSTESDLDNQIAQLLLPSIHKLLDKSLFDLYQVLYTIDVQEEFIKEKIMDLQNTSMIPSIIAFAIIDRLKSRYQNYPLLQNTSS